MSKPASAVQDPYAKSASGQDGISFVAPARGAPTDGSASLMTIYVPAENTTINLGAGTPPGITMFTAHHIGMWAGAPQTTVFLGTNAGGVDGIDIYTAAEKKEVIALHTEEVYQNTKAETVGLALIQNYNDTKTENVAHALTENFHGAKNETVDLAVIEDFKDAKTQTVHGATTNHYLGTLTEDVGGNWTVDPVKGDFKVHATGKIDIKGDGDHKWLQVGLTDWLWCNDFKKTVLGSDASTVVGVKHDIRIGVHNDFRLGAHIDTKLAVRVVNECSPVIKTSLFKKKAGVLVAVNAAVKKYQAAFGKRSAALVNASATAHVRK